MTSAATVSVVVPAYNAAATIGATLTALCSQANPGGQTEIIVVDNASSDDTAAIARSFPVATVFEGTRGPSAARNCGLRLARGEVVCHVDADAIPSRRWLAEIVKPFQDGSVLIVGGRTQSYPPETPAQRYTSVSGRSEPETNIDRSLFAFVPSQNMAVRRAAAVAVGGWAEDMMTAEDVDFCHRVLQHHPGGQMAYAPRAVVLHRERASDDELRDQAWSYGQGAARIYRRYPDEISWDLAKSLHLFGVLLARGSAPWRLRLARLFGHSNPEEIEFATYHRLWTWWWWRGFFSVYCGGQERQRP